eukprot:342180_1
MSTVGNNFKSYIKGKLESQTTANGTAIGVKKILTQQLKLTLSHAVNYNTSYTLDGKYKKLGLWNFLHKEIGYGDGYWRNWCKMHVNGLTFKEMINNCQNFALLNKLINKCCEKTIHKTGGHLTTYMGPYYLTTNRFIDTRMPTHSRRTYNG